MTEKNCQINVLIPGGYGANTLGVVRGFGRRNIPVIYIDLDDKAIAKYSRYITKKLKFIGGRISEKDFISMLINFGKKDTSKKVIIPTGDINALSISKHKKELYQLYGLPIAEFSIIEKIIKKKNFYRLLKEMNVDHPKTFIPENLDELRALKTKIPYPFIIKPSDSILFQKEFFKKCFIINSQREFEKAIERLIGKDLDVMIQEVIPGDDKYEIYMYFNKMSEPLAVCGYDKLRFYPPDFGSGSFCQTNWKSTPINIAVELLRAIGYHGIAAPEFIKDPRDNKYKLIEINARTTLQNRLAARCGLDIEYIACLDVTGQSISNLPYPPNGTIWADNFYDLLSCLMHLKNNRLKINDIIRSLRKKKIHSVTSWDDPVPIIFRFLEGLQSIIWQIKKT